MPSKRGLLTVAEGVIELSGLFRCLRLGVIGLFDREFVLEILV
jgi:hypothetical protein